MKNKNNNTILVSGSLVYDRIMDFPGFFKDHILPDKIHILNVSFLINGLKEGFGGTAGNIAYNLSLLGLRPKLLGIAGEDFGKYANWLKKQNIDLSQVKTVKGELTANAYIMADKSDNQITAFYPGPVDTNYCQVAKKYSNAIIAIVSPDAKERMLEYVKIYKANQVPYILDPGQQITCLTGSELKRAINGAKVLIGNDYEIHLTKKKTGCNIGKLRSMVEILIITKGAKGSEIYKDGKKIKIPSAKPKNDCDPTGAGDAYRAGLIKGLIEGWPLEKTGRLAGLVSVYTVEKYGTQTHGFSMSGLRKRYRENFGEEL